MFERLGDRLQAVFDGLKGKGVLKEADIDLALREIRIALLEADVALPVVKSSLAMIKEKALGQEVVKSVSPGQMVVKIVNDALVEMLGSEEVPINLNAAAPVVILMAGLQGSGKTTTTAKIALELKKKQHKKPLLASLDIYRPAAREQLATLGKQTAIDTLPILKEESVKTIAKRALDEARQGGYDILFLDTAGRLHIDDALMHELEEVKKITKPHEILLVADALTGQDAVNIALSFHEKIQVTGIVLTRLDGDSRGGAALSMRHVTGCPIKYAGIGEKITDIEPFYPERMASRILGMGDVVSLVEKASEHVDEEDAKKLLKKVRKTGFDLDDLAKQLKMMGKMGGLGGIMGMMPGLGKMKKQLDEADMDDSIIAKQLAIISSMTKKERKFPKLLNASRKQRITKGAGVSIQEVNRLLKQHHQMAKMMKKMGNLGPKALMRSGLGNMLPPMR